MTPARRAEFGRLTCRLVQAAHSYDRDDILAAEAALLAFVEREKGGMGTHKPDCIGGYSCEADCGRAILARREKEGA